MGFYSAPKPPGASQRIVDADEFADDTELLGQVLAQWHYAVKLGCTVTGGERPSARSICRARSPQVGSWLAPTRQMMRRMRSRPTD